jgi:RNA polymerase sigma-70 factor, ECF subfamily
MQDHLITHDATSLEDAKDTELIKLVTRGNMRAFEVLMRRHNRLLFRTARSIVKDDSEAEEILQEAYLKAWRALDGFREEATVSTWLVRIVVNEALSKLRKRKRAAVIPIDAHVAATLGQPAFDEVEKNHPESIAMMSQMKTLLESHIDALPDVFRPVFILRAVQELSVEETATALNIPEATVRSRFFRARGMLREALAREIDVATTDAFGFDGARCDRIVANVLSQISR